MKNKILVTGHKGYIGGGVKEALEKKGYEVIGLDIKDGIDLVTDDFEDKIKEVDAVFHIAAQADLTTMYDLEGAHKGFEDNVVATNRIAYLCAKHNKWLIYASTVCVYGNQEEHPETEDTTLPNPSEMYACTKYAAEWIVRGYGLNFGMPWTSLRFATIYGPGHRNVMGTHIFATQALKGEPITVHGDGKQDRTLTHIDDLVRGIVSVLDNKEKANGQIINLTNSKVISANQVAEDAKRITGSDSEIVHTPQRANQTIHEEFSVTKAKEILGWEAEIPWEEGYKQTIDYIKENEL